MQSQTPPLITVLDQKVANIIGKNHCIILSGKDENNNEHVVRFYAEKIYNEPDVIKTAENEFQRHIESKKCPGCKIEK